MPTYPWTTTPPPAIPAPPAEVPAAGRGPVGAVLDSAVGWVLGHAGLLGQLERVTGDGAALHGTAECWRDAAVRIRDVSVVLREGGAAVGAAWDGEASEAFGAAMGTYVAVVDDLCGNAAAIADVLNRAAVACVLAERVVVEIVADAAAWVAAELAVSALAGAVTLGLATVAGAVAESATLALFVDRAAAVSAGLAVTLEELAAELAALNDAREALRLTDMTRLRQALNGMPILGEATAYLETAAAVAGGPLVGLPVGITGVQSPATIVGHTIQHGGDDYYRTVKRKN
jgi:uncharacterized protein YukE